MVTAPSTRDSLLVVIMARLLTALALLLAFTVTLASFASTAAARSFRLPGNGALGAVNTAGGGITAESAGDEQDRRELIRLRSTAKDGTLCSQVMKRDCSAPKTIFMGLIKADPAAAKCSSKQHWPCDHVGD
ncbi:unnamed protein product [Closterium sp. Yama58-4]|nr:unnamed protein product [Closterium sp. Yama58-4]